MLPIRTLLFCALLAGAAAGLCVDDDGREVDWWIILKYPRNGTYIISTSSNPTFVISNEDLKTRTNAFVATNSFSYSKESSTLMYNDEFPATKGGTKHSRGAHSKGVVTWDRSNQTGFWIVHSVPSFPSTRLGGCCPSDDYGQSLLCLSLNNEGIADALQYVEVTDPHVYLNYSDIWVPSDADPFVKEQSTIGGQSFQMFSRSGDALIDLYKYVADFYQSDVMTETWQNGSGGKDKSKCSPRDRTIENIEGLSLLEASFDSSSDHSKWAILGHYHEETPPEKQVVCIGDINRMDSQLKRGGGTVCLNLPDVWTQFRAFVTDAEACRSN